LTASAGLFDCAVGPRAAVSGAPDEILCRRRIKLSLPLLQHQPEHEILGTLAHEMIHQWQFDVLKRRPNHGSDFRRKMTEMNREGLGISIQHDLDAEAQALAKYAWECRDCGQVYQRHRRSIRPRRHACGSCRGRLREIPLPSPEAVPVHQSPIPETGHPKGPSRRSRANRDTPNSVVQLAFDFAAL
ncbi:MAG: SprT-like domain-containing protein, partial [Nitrospirales bacterium]